LVAADPRFRCLRLGPEAGGGVRCPAIPRNAALDQVRGALVCFLDVDDLWHPEKLERQLAFHQRHRLDISVTAYGRAHANPSGWLTWRCPPASLSFRRLIRSNAVPMLTVMIDAAFLRNSALTKPLRFSPVRHEDYVLWLQLWRKVSGLRYGCLPELLALHQRHESNTTSRRASMIAWLYDVYISEEGMSIALWRTLIGSFYQLVFNASEALGARRLHCDPLTVMEGEPVSIGGLRTYF
jgi:teichuronic acid biosynthesis glycosyltransferase TuaG